MNLTAKEIAVLVEGEISGDGGVSVSGAASLEEATPSDVSFFQDPKFLKSLSTTKAGVLLLKKDTAYSKTAVFVDNPQLAFAKILALLSQEREDGALGIHPTAVISPKSKIGSGVCVGAHSVIEADTEIGDYSKISAQCYVGVRSKIGKNCKIYPQVVIREDCQVGSQVIIHSGAVIGSDGFGYTMDKGVHHKIPQIGKVILEDDVEIGANVTIDRATLGDTVVGKGTKVDNLVQIAHNVKIGQGCILVSQAGVAGSSTLGNYVTLAGQVGVVGHISIGDRAIVAAQSGISNDVPPGAIVFGSPARPIAQERRIQVIIGKLPKIYEEFKKIKKILKLESVTEGGGEKD